MFCPNCGKETAENATFCAGCGVSLTSGQPAKKRVLSTIAGIVEIAAGVLTALLTIVFVVAMLVAEDLPSWYVLFPITTVILGALAIIGGICALRRKHWGMALTGAIAVIWPTTVVGIVAVVLNIMARDEFER
jgi:zinc-ribbon domain